VHQQVIIFFPVNSNNEMVKNLTPEKIHLFIVEDFKGAWDSIAANPKSEMGRGNFMFARQAMNLLESAS
jgi:hypothetical protein